MLGVWRGVACGECKRQKRRGTGTAVSKVGGGSLSVVALGGGYLSVVVLAVLGLAPEGFRWGSIEVREN